MTSTTCEGGLSKVDRLGRVHLSDERRRLLLEEYDRSGLSGQAFAKVVIKKLDVKIQWDGCLVTISF